MESLDSIFYVSQECFWNLNGLGHRKIVEIISFCFVSGDHNTLEVNSFEIITLVNNSK